MIKPLQNTALGFFGECFKPSRGGRRAWDWKINCKKNI